MPTTQPTGRGRLILSVVVICLLTTIAIGVYFVPRFNYETIAKRQAENTQHLRRIDDSLRGSVLHGLPSLIGKLSKEYDQVLATLTLQARRLDAIEESIDALQDLRNLENVPNDDADEGPVDRLRAELRALNVPAEVEEAAMRFPTMQIKRWKNDRFIDELIRAGVIPVAEPEALLPHHREGIEEAFDSFKISTELIRSQQKLTIDELIREVDASGENGTDYYDIPLGLSHEEASTWNKEAQELLGPAEYSTARTKPELNVKRLYRFSYDRYEKLREFPWLRDQSRLRLFSQIDQITHDK